MNKTYYENINESVYHTICDNGLNVYIIPKKGFSIKSAYFATKFGSFNTGDTLMNEDKKIVIPGGVAHFLEHRVFDYKKGNIIDLYYKLGADVNAYTSYDRTVYYFSTNDNFKECLELLLDFPTSFTMSNEAVENEKDIIVNELLMYKDDPNDKLFKVLMNAMYKEHPVRYDVGGEPQEVKETTREILEMAHSTYYNPKNMYLVVVGDVDVNEVISIVNNKKFNSDNYSFIHQTINEDSLVVQTSVDIEAEVNNKKLLLGYKFKPLDNLDEQEKSKVFLSFDLLTSILFSRSSEFYKELIENNYVSFLANDILEYPNMFTVLIEADILKDENEVIEKIESQMKNAMKILTQEKLDSIKRKEIASVIKGSDSSPALAKNFMTYILDNMNYCTLIDLIKSIDLKDIKNAYDKYYVGSQISYAVLRGKHND